MNELENGQEKNPVRKSPEEGSPKTAAADGRLPDGTDGEAESAVPKTKQKSRFSAFFGGALCGVLFAGIFYICSTGFINFPFLGSFVIGSDPTETLSQTASPSAADDLRMNYGKINLKLRMIEQILNEHHYYPENPQDVEDGIFAGLMYALTEQDPYAMYFSAEQNAEQINRTRGNYYGIGALVTQDLNTNVMTVTEVYEGSPAEEAGLCAGDILKTVNKEDITYMDLSTVVDEYIKGPEGSYVNLGVERDGSLTELQIKRGKVETPSVYASLLEDAASPTGKSGYLYVSSFDAATVGQFRKEIDRMEAEGAGGLVIDLRNNLGGVMNAALDMLDYLLSDELSLYSSGEENGDRKGETLLLYTENIQGRSGAYYAKDGHQTELPVAVLINEMSASASEIFAGTLKDYKRGLIVGENSYGKGIVQTDLSLPDGSAIKYTSDQYFTPSGYAVHGQGVKPDIEVLPSEELLEAGISVREPDPVTDNQLSEAMKALYQKR